MSSLYSVAWASRSSAAFGGYQILLKVRAMKLILILIATITFSMIGNATEISGVVRSADGKPLVGVRILTYAPAGPANIVGIQVATSSKRYEVTTDASRSFSMPSHGQLIYFHRLDLAGATMWPFRESLALDEVTFVGNCNRKTLPVKCHKW